MADFDSDSSISKNPGEEVVSHQQQSAANLSRPFSLSYDRSRRFYVFFIVSLYLLYMLLIQLVRLRYRGEKEGPFVTHDGLMRTTIAAFLVAGITSGVMYNEYIRSYSKSSPPVVFKIARIVFSLSAFLAFITLLLVLIRG